jgi:NADPH:quinone reductase-like Zn-dependent oxidoreductase
MRAVGFQRFGGPDVLEVVELPAPVPGEGEIRVRVAAATINPTDLAFRSGARASALAEVEPPYVPGMELAGTVEAVGPHAGWAVGERVAAITTPLPTGRGAQAELVVVAASSAVRVPSGTTLEQAATLPMNGLTVRRALDDLRLQPGDTLAVTGAAGAVGGYAVQIAAAEGARVVAVAAPADEQLVTGFGASVFVPRGEGAASAIRTAVPEGVDAVIDAALLGPAILPAVREGGRVEAVRPFDGEADRGIGIHVVRVTDYRYEHEKLLGLARLVEQRRLTLRVAETVPPERAAQAHARLEAGGVRGRLVIGFPGPPSAPGAI